MHDKIMSIIFDKDDISWQTLIYDLVKNEQMDPWDVDVSLISEKFIQMVRQLQEMDFRISGKVILAAALLLKIKAVRLVTDDISDFDKMFSDDSQMTEEQFYEDLEGEQQPKSGLPEGEEYQLIPRTPQPRKRKVSVYDLVAALQKALEVKHRRVMRDIPEIKVHLPEHHVDINVIITKLYDRIENYLQNKGSKKITFSQLVPSDDRIDKVMTFIPLLHLTSQRKIDLDQQQHFGEIDITLATVKPADIQIEDETPTAQENRMEKQKEEYTLKAAKKRQYRKQKKSEEHAADIPEQASQEALPEKQNKAENNEEPSDSNIDLPDNNKA